MGNNYSNEKFEACYKDACVRSQGKTAKALNWTLLVGLCVLLAIGVAKALKG